MMDAAGQRRHSASKVAGTTLSDCSLRLLRLFGVRMEEGTRASGSDCCLVVSYAENRLPCFAGGARRTRLRVTIHMADPEYQSTSDLVPFGESQTLLLHSFV